MVTQSSLFAAVAAVLLSSIAVASAVGPATPAVSVWNGAHLHA